MKDQPTIGIIGGSGLYELGLLENQESLYVHTPYGAHSDGLRVGDVGPVHVAFLPRHGARHSIPPHLVPYRANLWVLRELGVRRLVTVSAMGGMRSAYAIGDVCVPDQILDWTKGRAGTYFDGPQVIHTPFSEPFCALLRSELARASKAQGMACHEGGTVMVFDGPRFSTKAESLFYRNVLHADLLSMTAMPEAILARELGICYGTLAVVSDLDAFGDEEVNANEVNAVMRSTLPPIVEVLRLATPAIADAPSCTDCLSPPGSPYRAA